jgi:hypothetical protein
MSNKITCQNQKINDKNVIPMQRKRCRMIYLYVDSSMYGTDRLNVVASQ